MRSIEAETDMRHRHLSIITLALSLLFLPAGGGTRAFAAHGDNWNIPDEIRRLYKEAPSIAAYPDVKGVVWLNSFTYDLAPDGTMQKNHRFLMLSGQHRAGEDMAHVIPMPREEGASLVVKEAAWYNPMTGMKEGSLPLREISEDGIGRVLVEFPKETEGRVVALATQETYARKPYFDDALFLADEYPIWEQSVTLEIPDGMDLYWQGEGVREPSKRKASGREITSWTLMNQPIWQRPGIVDVKRPSLAFSLRKGLYPYLRSIQEVISKFQAPPPPSDLNLSDKGGPIRAGEDIDAFISKNLLAISGYPSRLMKARELPPVNGPWTPWEGTLIAGRWLEGMGYAVDVYWSQAVPISEDGPAALDSWAEPVLVVKAPGVRAKEIYYKAGQAVEFGKIPPSLRGSTIYRLNGSNLEKQDIPRGNASEHTLVQMWKLAMDEQGIARGTLEITATGSWVNVLGYGRVPRAEGLANSIAQDFIFNAPGLSLGSSTVKPIDSGYRMAFKVTASLGIVSGGGILMRVPAVVPRGIEEIGRAGERYSFRFPFTLEQSINISTPKGYKVIGSPPGEEKLGDPKVALLEESMIHWPKRGELEVAGKWTVRTQDVDEALSKVILNELDSYVRWSQTTLPLRKR